MVAHEVVSVRRENDNATVVCAKRRDPGASIALLFLKSLWLYSTEVSPFLDLFRFFLSRKASVRGHKDCVQTAGPPQKR